MNAAPMQSNLVQSKPVQSSSARSPSAASSLGWSDEMTHRGTPPLDARPANDAGLGGPGMVFVVDDDVSVRESLEALLLSDGWRCETFESAEAFLSREEDRAPSCLVLDVNLPELGGLDLQKRLAEGGPGDLPVIFISGDRDIPTSVRAMKAGAVEFLTKPFDADALLGAVRPAIARNARALKDAAELQALRQRYASLSPREREVMDLIVAGRLNKQVGGDLGISEITVKAHRGQTMRKMQARSFADLVRMSLRLGPSTPSA
jgi:FixJ family two-component response regulator